MRSAALLIVLLGCGPAVPAADPHPVASASAVPAPPPPSTSASAAAPASDAAPAPSFGKLRATLLGERKIAGDVRGIAFDAAPDLRLAVNVGGALLVFDPTLSPLQMPPHAWRPGDRLLVVGPDAFDGKGGGRHDVPVPKALQCEVRAFSADGSRMSAYCRTDEAAHVFDVVTGAEIGVFKEFQSAAPIRSASITTSGNFLFWAARAGGAFEEIKSHVTGPAMSSHSVMSPNEQLLFTTVDRNWYSSDTSRAQVLDPKNGHQLFTLPSDVETAVFSPSSRTFAAIHSSRWADMEHSGPNERRWVTLHASGGPAPLVRVPGDDVAMVAISPADDHVATYGQGVVRVYALEAAP